MKPRTKINTEKAYTIIKNGLARKTDWVVTSHGINLPIGYQVGMRASNFTCLLRPLKPAKKPKARVKSVAAYGILKNGKLLVEAFPNPVGIKWLLGVGEKCVPVTISLRSK